MQTQQAIIAKYDNTKIKNYDAFIGLPLEIFKKGLSREAIGFYIVLSSYAGLCVHYEGKKALVMSSARDLLQLIKWNTKKANILAILNELVDAKLIQVYNRDDSGEKFDIIFPRINQDKKERFAKLYAAAIRKIMSKATGKVLLSRLVFYAAMRTGIFENSTSSQIFEQSPCYVAQITRINADVIRHNFKWLRDNDIVAFYRCKVTPDLGYDRYYYAEYRDWKKLKDVINGYIKQDVVREVIA